MNEIIWVCTANGAIFPNEEEARIDHKDFLENSDHDYGEGREEERFEEWYTEMTFKEYNERYAG